MMRPMQRSGQSSEAAWRFDPRGPDATILRRNGSVPLASRGMKLPRKPGLYLVTCGDCLAHVGTSKNLARRVGDLARLGPHHGSSEVLCAAFCTRRPPLVWWEQCASVEQARKREVEFKHNGDREPPVPRPKYESCANGGRLKATLLRAAGDKTWGSGYVEAVFDIGSGFRLLFGPRFHQLWAEIGVPPGPWAERMKLHEARGRKARRNG